MVTRVTMHKTTPRTRLSAVKQLFSLILLRRCGRSRKP